MRQIAFAIRSLYPISISTGKQMPAIISRIVVTLLLLVLISAEIFRVWFVMPYPGSQQSETVDIAYWLSTNIVWIRILFLPVIVYALVHVFKKGRLWEKICLSIGTLAYIVSFSLFTFMYDADAIFHQPSVKSFKAIAESEDKSKLVIGVSLNGEAKAYPIQLIGYHHQVIDTIGNEPVIITYCTICRTGRVYSTIVNGKHESFRLIGMDHYNAIFEDKTTKTWWQQANGEAIAGPLKGAKLQEIESVQLTINAWMRQHPSSTVLRPDPQYGERYFNLEDYDKGEMHGTLAQRDYSSWKSNSWIVGVKNETEAVAYDWNELVRKRVIQDSLKGLPILLAIESDTTSFHVYNRRLDDVVLQFTKDSVENVFIDLNTHSTWNMDGLCIEGVLKGLQLNRVQAYNEFWHSWEKFQDNAKKYIAQE